MTTPTGPGPVPPASVLTTVHRQAPALLWDERLLEFADDHELTVGRSGIDFATDDGRLDSDVCWTAANMVIAGLLHIPHGQDHLLRRAVVLTTRGRALLARQVTA